VCGSVPTVFPLEESLNVLLYDHLAKLPLANDRTVLIILRVFLYYFFVLILYDADPPEPARAPPRGHADSLAMP
jgi:hypothetical protein